MSRFTLRRASEDDLAALVSMRLALQELMSQRDPAAWRPKAGAEEHARLQMQGWLRDPAYFVLVACAGDAIIGMAAGQVERQPDMLPSVIGHIRRVFVVEGWRQRGVGKALVARLCVFFAERGVEEVSLRYVSGNQEGERFWSGLGFEPRLITAGERLSGLEARLNPRAHTKGGKTMLDAIFARRSIRQYTSEPVSETDIRKLLEAAMAAPSAADRKPWHFVVVTDRASLNALAEALPYGKMLSQAALAIVICGDPQISERYWVQDCSAATENLLLAATALGLGAVWLAVEPVQERRNAVAQVLGIPNNIGILNVVSIGHPAEEKEPRTQYDEERVHHSRW